MATEVARPAEDNNSLAAPENRTQPDASSTFLGDITGNRVLVKLHSGLEYHGRLQSVDGFMNIALEETKEVMDDKVTNSFGDVFIRGNNVLYISAV